MEDYAKHTSREQKDHIILQVGKKNLPTWKNPNEIAKNIMQLASTLKNQIMRCIHLKYYCNKLLISQKGCRS